jgi:hypothetical protein
MNNQGRKKMAKKKDAREMLSRIYKLIEKDIAAIERGEEVDDGAAATLVRYSDALLRIAKDQDGQDESEKEQASKLTSEEILAQAAALAARKKS